MGADGTRGQEVRGAGVIFKVPSPIGLHFPKRGPGGGDFRQCQVLLGTSLSILLIKPGKKSLLDANVSLIPLLPMFLSPSPTLPPF